MDVMEMNKEILECARYGEDDDLRALIVAGADPNYCDESGNTSLHRAAANGEVKCILVLKELGALHIPNKEGNYPIHWAAQNAKADSLKTLFDNYEVDVLAKNNAGRSTLTDAFDSKEVAAIELCLSHSSASEERLIETNDANAKVVEDKEGDKESSAKTYDVDEHAVSHQMKFRSDIVVRIRELPITRADHPFGSESAPEDDTTGLGIWPASIILSRWAVKLGAQLMNNKVVVELGAGCGLPAIAAALHCRPRAVFVTDIHEPTIANSLHNARLNQALDPHSKADSGSSPTDIVFKHSSSATEHDAGVSGDLCVSTAVRVLNVNWKDFGSFPAERADVLLGSDLVYDSSILAILVPAVDRMMTQDGCLLYVAPNTGRDGMSELIDALAAVKIVCSESMPVPNEMYGNPLVGVDEDYFVLHFYDLCAKQPHTLYRFTRQQ